MIVEQTESKMSQVKFDYLFCVRQQPSENKSNQEKKVRVIP